MSIRILPAQESKVTLKAVITDKGYDARANRRAARRRGNVNAKDRSNFFTTWLHRLGVR